MAGKRDRLRAYDPLYPLDIAIFLLLTIGNRVQGWPVPGCIHSPCRRTGATWCQLQSTTSVFDGVVDVSNATQGI